MIHFIHFALLSIGLQSNISISPRKTSIFFESVEVYLFLLNFEHKAFNTDIKWLLKFLIMALCLTFQMKALNKKRRIREFRSESQTIGQINIV